MISVKKAVIPVAGFGTRFLPFTKAVPKAMLPIVDKPAIQVIVEEVLASGIEEIIFIVGQHSEIIERHFSVNEDLEKNLKEKGKTEFLKLIEATNINAKVRFVEQGKQLGTAHAVRMAEKYLDNEPFLLVFGDDVMYNAEYPVSKQLIDNYEKYGKTVIGVKQVPRNDVPKYASVEFNNNDGRAYFATRITEKPKLQDVKSNLSPLGRYVCSKEVMGYIKNLKPGANGEYQITDVFNEMCPNEGVIAYEFEGTRYDTGDKLGYLKAVVEYALRDDKLGDSFAEYLKTL